MNATLSKPAAASAADPPPVVGRAPLELSFVLPAGASETGTAAGSSAGVGVAGDEPLLEHVLVT